MLIRPFIGASSAIDYILQDTFTDTNGVLIPAHTGELFPVGGWTDEYSATPKPDIQSNKFSNTRTTSPTQHYIDCGQADNITIHVVGVKLVSTTGTPTFAVFGRWAAGAFWQVELSASNLSLMNTTSTVDTTALTTPNVAGLERSMSLTFSGNNISGEVDGGEDTVSTTNALRNTATVIGLRVVGVWVCDEIYVE